MGHWQPTLFLTRGVGQPGEANLTLGDSVKEKLKSWHRSARLKELGSIFPNSGKTPQEGGDGGHEGHARRHRMES